MEQPHKLFEGLPKSELQLIADGQANLLRQRKGWGVPVDDRSVENLNRVEAELDKAN